MYGGTMDDWIARSKTAASNTGLDWQNIFAQWYHETAGFTSDVLGQYNNAAGMFKDDLSDYITFPNLDSFVDQYSHLIKLYANDGVTGGLSSDDFAQALKNGGYYGDTVQNYQNGMKNALNVLNNYIGGNSSFNQPAGTTGSTTTQPAASNNSVSSALSTWLNRLNPANWFEFITGFANRVGMFIAGGLLITLGFVALNSGTITEIAVNTAKNGGE